MKKKSLTLTISSESGNYLKVENFIERIMETFCLSPRIYANISLAILEAIDNAILHGNKGDARKKVKIRAWFATVFLFVSVEDEGEGFDYSSLPDPAISPYVCKSMGRGLYLMRRLSDGLKFEKNGAKVTMVFFIN